MLRFDDPPSIPLPRTSPNWSCDVADQRDARKITHKHGSKEVIEHMQSPSVPFRNFFFLVSSNLFLARSQSHFPFLLVRRGIVWW